jgi:uncharacterized glyoxalase superfamily protein PhnB
MPAPSRFQSASPVFLVGDIAATMRWYETVLGFDADPFPESPPHVFCILRKDGVEIMLQHHHGYRKPALYEKREGGVWNVYLRIQGVRPWYEALSGRDDVKMLEPLCRQPYGQTEFVIEDPNGYVLVLAEPE